MKVRIDIPVDFRLHDQGTFRIEKQLTSAEGEKSWETVVQAAAMGGGSYVADLEPGQYQKVLETADGQFLVASPFRITEDNEYLNEIDKKFTIAEDGTLSE